MDVKHLGHVGHLLHQLHKGERHGIETGNLNESRLAAVGYIIVGIFLTPMLIGIPIILYGVCKLMK